MMERVQEFLQSVLRGVGQVMLQENSWTGLLFLIGIAINSPYLALLALLATVIATLFAYGVSYSRDSIKAGLYGYNATLVGIACGIFLEPTWLGVLLFIGLVILVTVVTDWAMSSWHLPTLTAPFVVVAWVLLGVIALAKQTLGQHSITFTTMVGDDPLSLFGIGMGQVMLEPNILTGYIFLLGVLISSPRAALYIVISAIVTAILCMAPIINDADAQSGLYLYNTVLVAIFVSTRPRKYSAGLLLIGTLLSFSVQHVGLMTGIPTLTAPFVVVAWILYGIIHLRKDESKTRW